MASSLPLRVILSLVLSYSPSQILATARTLGAGARRGGERAGTDASGGRRTACGPILLAPELLISQIQEWNEDKPRMVTPGPAVFSVPAPCPAAPMSAVLV
ncbi:hypothetical protein C2845_PM02G12930 [Panicum miliaceum]|uniref:Uncharacterized protein n=1 Tax=Panicum miliaceum TaxID=4540 RepID=A0A3L6SAP4_PANMI|nr:hypothetical protein C2845_PM02G12930 [Panicum miliaceum]